MTATEIISLKKEVHQFIDLADERIIKALYSLFQAKKEPNWWDSISHYQQADAIDFLWEVKALDKINGEEAISLLYEKIGEYLDSQLYDECDKKIIEFLGMDFTFRLHLGLLTLTNMYKQVLPARVELFRKTEDLALVRYSNDKKSVDHVLKGLQ